MQHITDSRTHSRSPAGFCSAITRGISNSRIPLCLMAILLSLPSAAYSDTQQKPSEPARIAALVTRLGAPSFRERIQAEADCLQTGPSVLPALLQALKNQDPEVRRRAQLLIDRIEVDEVEESITAFLLPGSTSSLPGWTIVTDLVGDSPQDRFLFAELMRGDIQLVRALKNPKLLPAELLRQLQEIGTVPRGMSQHFSVSHSTVLLLLLLHPQAKYSADIANGGAQALRQGAAQGVNETAAGQLLQALLTRWIMTPSAGQSVERFDVAWRLSLPESIIPAVEMLDQKPNLNQLNNPLVAIARYGGAPEMAVVEKMLDNSFELHTGRGPNNEKTTSTQVRDMALATLIEMTHQDPLTYGLPLFHRDNSGNIQTVGVAFESDQKRDAAFEQWREWSRQNLKKYWQLPRNAEEGTSL